MKKILLLVIGLIAVLSSYAQSYNYDQAMDAIQAKDYEKAVDYLTRDLKDNPRAGLTFFYRAVLYHYNDQNSQALSDINNAIKYLSAKEKKMVASAYLVRAKIYLKIDDNAKALNDYGLAIKLDTENTDAYIDRAHLFYQLKQYDKAETDYRQVLKIDEGELRAWTGLGRNNLVLKNFGEAEKILSKVIKLDPNYMCGYYYRGLAYYEQGKIDEALEDIFQCLVLDDSDKDMRGLFVDYAAKNYPLAISKVNRQISLHPLKDIWYYIRARIHESRYDLSSAIADYTKVIELADINFRPILLATRAKCYSSAGMYEKAVNDFTESLSIDSTNAYNYGYMANTKRLMGNYTGSIADFNRAIDIEPREAWFYYSRGWSKEFIKDYEGARSDYDEAISLDKTMAYYFLNRGRLYETHLKNPVKAKEDYHKILLLDTLVMKESNCRQYALFHLGRNEEAISWLNKVLEQYPVEGNYYDAACLYSLMNRPAEAIASLKMAFQKGYRDFIHISADDDLINIRDLPEFKKLVEEWTSSFEESLKRDVGQILSEQDDDFVTVSIPMRPKGSGVYEIPCKINELPLQLIFDTGASDISISQTEVQFMLKNGFLKPDDITGANRYMDANGDVTIGTKIVLRKVDFGGLILKNIDASVVQNKMAPMLFGQSALSKYGKIVIDNEKQMITITNSAKKK